MGRVVVLGSLNVDLVAPVRRHPSPGETVLADGMDRYAGGKGGNQAVAAAAAGARVAMVGCVGSDEAGRAYVGRLGERGVDTSAVVTVEGPSGHALITVDDAGENAIVVVPGANGEVTWERVGAALGDLAADDVLLVQLEIPFGTVGRAARLAAERGARVVLNTAPYADLPPEVLDLADPVVANEHEAQLLAAAGAAPGSLLVTRGADGAEWGDVNLPAVVVDPAEVVDTTGAGDAFCGALAAALADGADREQALRAGLRAGAAAVRHRGAQSRPDL